MTVAITAAADAGHRVSVDVLVVTYRSQETIEACLASVPAGLRVIVVDNNSGDGSDVAARHAGAEVVLNDHNAGFARAVNQAARLSHADALLLLNPDARLRPGAVDALIDELDDPSVGIVGGRLLYPDGSEQRSRWPYPFPAGMWREAFGLDRLRRQGTQRDTGFVVGAALLIRRECWDQLGGFDPAFWLYGEEADLCFRAEQRGWRVVSTGRAIIDHVGGHSARDLTEVVAEHFARGSERFVHKHYGPRALASYRAASLVAALLRLPFLLPRPDDPRRRVRLRIVRRTSGALLRVPFGLHAPVPHRGRQLVVLSLEAWDDVWRRNQFLVRELVASDPDLRVLFVEPPDDVVHQLRTRRRVDAAARGVREVPGLAQVQRFRPRKWAPRLVWPWVDRSLANQVLAGIDQAGFDEPVVWLNDTTYAPLARRTHWRLVYDITDDWLAARVPGREHRRRVRREHAVLSAADEVVVCSPELQRRRSQNRPVHLIPNAVDTEHFQRPRRRPEDLPPGPVAVYVGSLHEDRLDVDLVVELTQAIPTLSIVLVGPDCLSPAARKRLDDEPNVTMTGPRPYDQVPGYLQHADLVVIPHLCNEFTESLDPIKAYECAVVGTSTVATPVPGFVDGGAAVRVAARADYVETVRSVLSSEAGRQPATVPGWDERAAAFAAVLFDGSHRTRTGRRFRVVYVGHVARPSGGEIALVRLLGALHEVDAHVILAEDGPLVARLREVGATVEVLPLDPRARDVRRSSVTPARLPIGPALATVAYAVRLSRRLRTLAPDLVHTNTLKAALYGGLAGRMAGVPVIWHIRDRIAADYLPRPAVHAVRQLARILPSAVIVNSYATADTLRRAGRVTTLRGPVVHDPVAQRPQRGEEPDPAVVGIIGRLAPWKGQHVFLRAFALAFPNGEVTARIVGAPLFGEDDYLDQLHRLVDDLGLEGRVRFTGHVDDIWAELARMTVVVHASVVPEPFGQVVVEAMAAGRPVIATNVGGPAEVIRTGHTGLLVPPDDVSRLAAAMQRLTDDAALRRMLTENAERELTRFAPEPVRAAVYSVYERVRRPCPRDGGGLEPLGARHAPEEV